MKAFIDSNFFIALSNKTDSTHKKALKILKKIQNSNIDFYTSYHIIDEVLTVLSQRLSKKEAIIFLLAIKESNFPIILDVDEGVREKSYKLFKKIKIKDISMIDCYSAILMKQNRIKKCFTFDNHFQKLGFETL